MSNEKLFAELPQNADLVVSGISGSLPKSQNIEHFMENLFNKTDLCDENTHVPFHNPDIPKLGGRILNISQFDNGYFGIHTHHAKYVDAGARIFLEKVAEAIFDAGLHPDELKNSKTGVFVGSCISEYETILKQNNVKNTALLIGIPRSMTAGQISYYFGFNGPAYNCDSACSSSLYAFDAAYRSILSGKCERAIVGGVHLALDPQVQFEYAKLGVLNFNSGCRPFDNNANGYTRGESVIAILLEKKTLAKRIYCNIVHCKTNNDGFKENGITYLSFDGETQLLRDVYTEVNVSPKDIGFIEAHGTGTKAGDPVELTTLAEFYKPTVEKPLLIGSVKGNMGHAEPAAATASIIKILTALNYDCIAPNIHYDVPRESVQALEEKRLKVVTDITPFPKDKKCIGVNSFGFGGSNAHLIMEKYNKTKEHYSDLNNVYPLRLICYSSRTKEGIDEIHSAIKTCKDVEALRLLQETFVHSYDEHLYRGFTITGCNVHSYSKLSNFNGQKLYIILQDFVKIQNFQQISEIPLLKTILAKVIKKLEDQHNSKLKMALLILNTLKELQIQIDPFEYDKVSEGISDYLKGQLNTKTLVKLLNSISNNNCIQQINSNSIKYGSKATIIVIGDSELMLPQYLIKKLNIIRFNGQQTDEEFLYNIGKIFEAGYNPLVHKLNDPIEFPVSPGTRFLSPLVHWKHKSLWMPQWGKHSKFKTEKIDPIIISNADMSYLRGHIINNRNLFPATGYLYHIWLMFVDKIRSDIKNSSVIFENVKFIQSCTITKANLELHLTLFNDGNFEIADKGITVVSGRIMTLESESNMETYISNQTNTNDNEKFVLSSKDVYRELRLRGYKYKGMFRAIQEASPETGKIKWEDNWVTFLDNMLQLSILKIDTRNLYVPVGIDRIVIRAKEHMNYINKLEDQLVPVWYSSKSNRISTKFIEIHGLNAQPIAKRKDRLKPVLEYYQFIPNEISTDLPTSMRINMQILLENKKTLTFKVVEFLRPKEEPVIGYICNVVEDMPLVLPDLTIVTTMDTINIENVKVTKKMPELNLLYVCQNPDYRLLVETQKVLIPDGFLLCLCNSEFAFDNNFTLLTKHIIKDQRIVYFLRRNTQMEKKTMIIEVSDSEKLKWVEDVQNKMKISNDVILFSQNNYKTGVLGLTNCLTKEPGIDNIRCVLNQDSNVDFDIINRVDNLEKQLHKNMVVNVFKNGQWGTYRHLLLGQNDKVSSYHWYGTALSPGNLSSVKWVEGPITPENKHIFKPHKVIYSALNFRDLMNASGKLVGSELGKNRVNAWNKGFEYAGYDMNGKRVYGFASRAIANLVEAPITSLEIPDEWEMEDAATVFIVYSTVIRGIQQIAEISKGKSILIHSGTGRIGLAALNICIYFECDIFVTVGTREKREYLLKNYPSLNPNHIGNSRDSSFKQMVLRETKGRGVDIALNSLADDKLQATVQCLAVGGVFIEIGKYDLQRNSQLSQDLAMKQCTFHAVMLDNIFMENEQTKELLELLETGIKEGYVKPLPRTVFQIDELEKAFKYMSTGRHIGKILIKIDHECEHNIIARFYCDPTKAHIIFGGLGGFGLELADWLILRGAKHIILSSRRGVTTGYQKYRINIWESYGVKVSILTDNVTNFDTCFTALRKIHTETPIDGIFNLALVLKDSLWTSQTTESMKTSMMPKSILTDHLDKVTRKICPQLRHFVVFSSVSCGRGNAGQANYGYSNSIMERICELRHADGLPALAVQWGAVGDVGILETMQQDNNEIAIGGTVQQKVLNCLEVLDVLMNQKHPIVSSMVVAEKFDQDSGNTPLDTVCLILGVKDVEVEMQHYQN